MADWVRSPSQRWFTNNRWVRRAFESARRSDTKWNSYYGQYGFIFKSKGLNPKDPIETAYAYGGTCGICDYAARCGSSAWSWVCQASKIHSDGEGTCCSALENCCPEEDATCGGGDCWENGAPPCTSGATDCSGVGPAIPCDAACPGTAFDCCMDLICNSPTCSGDSVYSGGNACITASGEWVDCDDEAAICDPCGQSGNVPSCEETVVCPCPEHEGGGCLVQEEGDSCPATCCVPGEPGCVPCCEEGIPDEECDTWVPEDMCCQSCLSCDSPGSCCPFGYPMPPEYCLSCEYCNVDPSAPQCISGECCCCPEGSCYPGGPGAWVDCGPSGCDVPICTDFSSNCYQCGDDLVPIWFDCAEFDPCPNPYNPDCQQGDELVCYEYNSNDPIYYNASNLGPSVIVEYDTPVTGTAYSYGNVATLCEIADSLQLCVYLVTSGDAATLLTYETDFTINESTATVTLNSSVSVSGYATLRFARCTDDKKMFMRFTEGAKLSADDLNASLHQLLFLIQEKEFAADTYYQIENAIALPGTVQFEINGTPSVAATGAVTIIGSAELNINDKVTLRSTSAPTVDIDFIVATAGAPYTWDPGSTNATAATALAAAVSSHADFSATTGGFEDSVVTITQATNGSAGNTAITIVDTGDPGMTAAAAFTGGVNITLSEFDTYTFDLEAYQTGTNVTKRYQFDDAGVIATGSLIDTDRVCIQINGMTTEAQLTEQIEDAINNVTNGHGALLATVRTTKDFTYDLIRVTQSVVGTAGNTAIVHDASLESAMYVDNWAFVDGVNYDQTTPMFTFSPPVSLPINFDLSSVQQYSVLSWDGDGSFIGRTPTQVGGQIQVDNLSNVTLGTVATGDFLYYSGEAWVNNSFATKVSEIVNVVDLTNWIYYDSGTSTLDNYIYTGTDGGGALCDTTLLAAWNASDPCVTNINKFLIPNAFTSFGLGYFAAERQISDQTADSTSAIMVAIEDKIANAMAAGGTLIGSFRWEISRSEGRDGMSVSTYPRAYFDIRDFDYLAMTKNTSSASDSNLAYYRDWGATTPCVNCDNKLFRSSNVVDGAYQGDVATFTYSQSKSKPFGFGAHSINAGTGLGEGKPAEDRYLEMIRRSISKEDWSTAFGYVQQHPLQDYPTAANDYPNAISDMIVPYYQYNTALTSGGMAQAENAGHATETASGWLWNSTKDMPVVVTYYLGTLWDASSASSGTELAGSGVPGYLQWDGNIDMMTNVNAALDYHTDSNVASLSQYNFSAPEYIAQSGNYWFYWKWWLLGFDSTGSGSTSDPAVFDTLSSYSPFKRDTVVLESDAHYSIIPACVSTDSSAAEDRRAALRAGYSFSVETNRAFSNLSKVLPDLYDEYVFEVRGPSTGWVTTIACDDAQCYDVVATIEKYIDGCVDGETNCTQIGTGGTNSAGGGFHVYPTDFDDHVVKAWDSYPYDKLGIDIRNKTGNGFDLVLRVPRLKRIGIIDLYSDTDDGAGNIDYRQASLEFISEYAAAHWDEADDDAQPAAGQVGGSVNKPALGDIEVTPASDTGISAFSFETAVQFIRLGIPTSVRVSFYIVSTPQNSVF